MDQFPEPVLVDREVTDQERELTKWMLEHGEPRARDYLEQLEKARVNALCPCGCATIDFAIKGHPRSKEGGMDILADFLYGEGDEMCGAFVFADKNGSLAGLEVYWLGTHHPTTLPSPSDLRPADFNKASK
jgi:hypothetical protein